MEKKALGTGFKEERRPNEVLRPRKARLQAPREVHGQSCIVGRSCTISGSLVLKPEAAHGRKCTVSRA